MYGDRQVSSASSGAGSSIAPSIATLATIATSFAIRPYLPIETLSYFGSSPCEKIPVHAGQRKTPCP
jgi:hypothetical protein